tara:strand:+ start:518 stop:742 length:225 start_codon:yes stop_codon:yes gene_type:complete
MGGAVMKMIKIPYDEGRFFIEDEELCYSYDGTLDDCCVVQDLTEMRVWEYNSLVDELNKHYPNYDIKHLTGSFI